ncbi:MAG: hypothetical protein WBP61_09595, partial [Nocardioides sp.]
MLHHRRGPIALLVSVSVALVGLVAVAAPAAAADVDVRINELSSNNPDFIVLVNTGSGPVDSSGWVLKDRTD